MVQKREHPEQPVVGVGGVVIAEGRALLIRRGSPPLEGQWSIPGGALELGETLAEGVARELAEETGLQVKVLGLIDVFERIQPGIPDPSLLDAGLPGAVGQSNAWANASRPQYHYVIADYLCRLQSGTARAGSDAVELAWAREEELVKFDLTPMAQSVLRKAFQMARDEMK